MSLPLRQRLITAFDFLLQNILQKKTARSRRPEKRPVVQHSASTTHRAFNPMLRMSSFKTEYCADCL